MLHRLEKWFASRFRAEDNCQVYLRRETRDNEGGGGKVSGTLCQQYFFHLLPSWIVILYDLRNSILRISLEWEVSEWSQSLQMTTGCTPKIIADVEHDARYLKNLSKQCFLPKVSQCNILRQRVFNCLTVCALNRRRMVAPFQSCWLTDSQQFFDSLTTVWLQLFEHMMSSLKELVWQKHSRVPCAFTNVSYTTDLESRPSHPRPQTLALLALTLALMPWIRNCVECFPLSVQS